MTADQWVGLALIVAVLIGAVRHAYRTRPTFDTAAEQAVDLGNSDADLPDVAAIDGFAAMVRQMPVKDAVYVMPGVLAMEIEAWLEERA